MATGNRKQNQCISSRSGQVLPFGANGRPVGLKASLHGLNIAATKLFILLAVVPDGARIIRKVLQR
jgi:hypothetical protein